jgi:acetyl esterase/lipase
VVLILIATVLGTNATSIDGDGDGRATPVRVAYGDGESQFGELWLPSVRPAGAPPPVVVLVHGGFWRNSYGLDLMDPLAVDLVGRGAAVWNIEYRRVGELGDGWTGTLADVAAAVDEVATFATEFDLDGGDIAVVGHSAGGHLALWAASRQLLPSGAPGAAPIVTPRLAVGLAPVADLVAAARDGVGDGAVVDFLGGGPSDVPERYAIATPSPAKGVDVVVVRGGSDDIVPAAYTTPPGSRPGTVTVVDVAGEDHFDLIDPSSRSWAATLSALGLVS